MCVVVTVVACRCTI